MVETQLPSMADDVAGAKNKGALHAFLVVSYETVALWLFSLPRYSVVNRIKAQFLRCMGAKVGKRVVFYPGVWIVMRPGDKLEIGDDVDLSLDVLIGATGGLTIGNRTLIGFRTQIHSSNHEIPPGRGRIAEAGYDDRPVAIGNDVWIGGNCMILPGVTIGDGAVVAAGSVVTKGVAPFTIVGGVPARLLKERC